MVTLRRSASVVLPAATRLARVGPLERRERKLFLAFLAPGLVLGVGAASITDAYDANWGELMAGSTMISLPLLVLFAFLGKYFIRGLSMGAVKS